MTAAAESKPPGTEPYLRRHGEDAVWFMGALFNPFASGEDTEGRFALIETVGRFARVCRSRISKPVSLLCLALGCTVLRSQWCQKFVDYTSLVPLRSTTLCDGNWYLDAMLGRDLHEPPHVWLVLKDGRPRLTVHRLTYLLEEALVQALRTPPHLGTLSAP